MIQATEAISLRDVQKRLLKVMLNLNSPPATDGSNEVDSAWKILILDSAGQAILSPILKVNELRESGVTLYLNLHGDRQPIADVPAIYFIEPTAANIARVSQDLCNGLYEQVYLNFTSSIPRQLLEDLAQQVAQSDCSHQIAKVCDQYLNFECLERNLFTFSMTDTFRLLNSAQTTEQEIEATLDKLSSSLLSVLLTMGGQCPLICAAKGTAAEMVGGKLEKRLKSHMTNIQSTVLGESNMGDSASLQRPLLVLLDRSFDMCTPLKHASTYNALVHDVLGMRLNRISITTKDGVKTFDVDGADSFWKENAQLPFPSVAENVEAALAKYKSDMQQVTRSSGVTSIDDLKGDQGALLTAEELRVAINVLPELTERKRLIDNHLQMATALLDHIRDRDLGSLFLAESQLQELTKEKLLQMIRKPEQGNASDKLRLFLVFYFGSAEIPGAGDMAEYERALREAGCEMGVVEAAKRVRSLRKMSQMVPASTTTAAVSSPSSTGNDLLDRFSSFGSKLSQTTTGVLGNIVSSVKNLLPESSETLLTKQIDLALELATGQPASAPSYSGPFRSASGPNVHPSEVFTLFDPRHRPSSPAGSRPTAYTHLIIFVIGGSNYSEYNHVEEWVRRKSAQLPMQATFGSTELLSGSEFLSQLTKL